MRLAIGNSHRFLISAEEPKGGAAGGRRALVLAIAWVRVYDW
jgi:hypothetical protein